MKLLDLTLESAPANIALDEALLESAEQSTDADDVLRLWEPLSPVVVIGRSSMAADEVHRDFCGQREIPIVRRASGGAAIVTGPGCLMYALVLNVTRWPELAWLDAAHRMVLQRNAAALQAIGIDAQMQGTSDLAVGDRKISGNSMRLKKDWVLYHGTLLYALPASLIHQCLRQAPRQPKYRRGRSHLDFVSTVSATADTIKGAFASVWNAGEPLIEWPEKLTRHLVSSRYEQDTWNFCR